MRSHMEHYLTPEYLEQLYGAEIVCDSVAPNGVRLVTTLLRMWRPILAEHNTHRACSRSVASSRALPAWKLVARCLQMPAVPVKWWAEHTGMQGNRELEGQDRLDALAGHLHDRDTMILAVMRDVEVDVEKMPEDVREMARGMHQAAALQRKSLLWQRETAVGLSKQIVNRKLEPWMVVEIVNTSTDLENLFALRCHPDAESNFEFVARRWRAALARSTPVRLQEGDWHLPFIRDEDRVWARAWIQDARRACAEAASHAVLMPAANPFDGILTITDLLKKISVARCARSSYLNHRGVRDPLEDVALHDRLYNQSPPHAAAFEHVAQALGTTKRIRNFRGWRQYRCDVPADTRQD